MWCHLARGPFFVCAGHRISSAHLPLYSPPWRRPLINPLALFSGMCPYRANKVLILLFLYIYIYIHIYVCLLTVLAETEAGTLLSFPIIPAQVHFPWFSLSLSQYEINLGLNCHLFLTKIFKRHKESQEDLVSVSTELCPAGPLCSPGAWQRLFVALHGPCA